MLNNHKIVLIFINTDWIFLLHRIRIVKSFQNQGFDICVLTKDTGKRKEIEALGFTFIDIDIDRKRTNPFLELKTIYNVYKIFKKVAPELVYQVTVKPIIYGGLVSKLLKAPTINTICGLGYVFSTNKKTLLKYVVTSFYKIVLKNKNGYTFFENRDDLKIFQNLDVLSQSDNFNIVNGVGVDLKKFKAIEKEGNINAQGKLQIILPARMLWDKGIKEFVEAAKILYNKYNDKVYFKLFGMIDEGNRESVPEEYLKEIEIKDYLKWFGFENNMVKIYQESDIVVLPSYYREGLPTVLAEACAMGKPIVTTNSVGCKECVNEGVNGFKVPVKSVKELANAIEKLIVSKELREQMGINSRKKAKKDFDQNEITNQYLEVFKKMILE